MDDYSTTYRPIEMDGGYWCEHCQVFVDENHKHTTATSPMNLYFPYEWTLTAADLVFAGLLAFDTKGRQGQFLEPGQANYLFGLPHNDWAYVAGRAFNALGFHQGVPAWVYTQARSPYTEGGK